jgi:hypothetical protein
MSDAQTERRADLAQEAYVMFFPMLMGYRYLYGSFLEPRSPSHMAPLNVLGGAPRTLDHTFRDVITPNADTPYSMAALDLRSEPMVLTVPPIVDRFYHFQLEDLWGHNVHYVGTRATGTGPGSYLLAGPGWGGSIPEGITAALGFETDVVFVIGRTQLLSPDDVETLGGIMASYRLEPLSAFVGSTPSSAEPYEWPVWNDEASRDERFIGYVNALLPLCRPFDPDDEAVLGRLAEIGIGPGRRLDADALEEGLRAEIRAGVDAARAEIAASAESLGEVVDGWQNIEVFGDRDWYAGDHLKRAAGAMAGWGGNDANEAIYPTARVDSEGRPLSGDHRYTLTLRTAPPAEAFWSFTMYDTSYDGVAGYLVDNPIGRYLVNSTTEGLVRGEDDSLTIHLQREAPTGDEARANWLPAPDGPFYVVMRLYLPAPAALDGTWHPPPIVRTD